MLCFIDQTLNSCLKADLNIYSSCLCFHPLNHNHDIKGAPICHLVPVFLRARFNPLQLINALQGCNHTIRQPDHRSSSQTLACIDRGTDKKVNDNPWQRGYQFFHPLTRVSWNVDEHRLQWYFWVLSALTSITQSITSPLLPPTLKKKNSSSR